MVQNDNLRLAKMDLNNGSGAIPALGFGTLIPDQGNQNRDQGGAGGGISPARRFGTLPQ
jgi:hypothetical protein